MFGFFKRNDRDKEVISDERSASLSDSKDINKSTQVNNVKPTGGALGDVPVSGSTQPLPASESDTSRDTVRPVNTPFEEKNPIKDSKTNHKDTHTGLKVTTAQEVVVEDGEDLDNLFDSMDTLDKSKKDSETQAPKVAPTTKGESTGDTRPNKVKEPHAEPVKETGNQKKASVNTQTAVPGAAPKPSFRPNSPHSAVTTVNKPAERKPDGAQAKVDKVEDTNKQNKPAGDPGETNSGKKVIESKVDVNTAVHKYESAREEAFTVIPGTIHNKKQEAKPIKESNKDSTSDTLKSILSEKSYTEESTPLPGHKVNSTPTQAPQKAKESGSESKKLRAPRNKKFHNEYGRNIAVLRGDISKVRQDILDYVEDAPVYVYDFSTNKESYKYIDLKVNQVFSSVSPIDDDYKEGYAFVVYVGLDEAADRIIDAFEGSPAGVEQIADMVKRHIDKAHDDVHIVIAGLDKPSEGFTRIESKVFPESKE